jgi:MFS family permease
VSVFKNGAVASILVQNFFFGIIFYGYLYYLPLYYQNVRLFRPLKSAYLTFPLQVTQSIASSLSGQYISRRKRYGECIWLGFILLTTGVSLTTLFNRTAPLWSIVLTLVMMGIGNGNVFQPTIISLQAHSPKSQRAIVISIRNFLRCLGGATGLAVSAAILQSTLRDSLPPQFADLAKSVYTKPNYADYSVEDANSILNAYEKASKAVFIFYAPVSAICLVCCIFVKDRGLQRKEEIEAQKAQEDAERAGSQEGQNGEDVEKALRSTTSLQVSEHEKEKEEEEEEAQIQKPALPAVDARI